MQSSLAPLVVPIAIVDPDRPVPRPVARDGEGRRDIRAGRARLFRRARGAGRLRISCGIPRSSAALSPHWAVEFFAYDPKLAFLAMGSVFLAMTGAETLYADMGHFGRKAIGFSWLGLVYPCLMLNYFGQGALLLSTPSAVENPFYLMAPDWARLPLVFIATAATIIASQAVISGAFSVTHQAVQLGFLPRLRTEHTSAKAAGQIYIPAVNWALAGDGRAAGPRLPPVDQPRLRLWHRGQRHDDHHDDDARRADLPGLEVEPRWLATLTIGLFALVDGTFFASNITKVADGGWFPLVVARGHLHRADDLGDRPGADAQAARRGRAAARRLHQVGGIGAPGARDRGVPVDLAGRACPSALLHNLKHNQVLHERVLILNVKVEDVPHVPPAKRLEVHGAGKGFYRRDPALRLHGRGRRARRSRPDRRPAASGFNMMSTSFFLGRQKLIAAKEQPGMALWRERLFAWMMKSSESAMEFFKLPTNRVIELGSQLRI